MSPLRYAAILGALCCLPPLVGCGATHLSASVAVGDAPSGGYYVTDDVIRSRINGDFTGWDGETRFPLENGQVWQQASYAYTYHYAYRPEVTIYQRDGGWVMQVEGMNETLPVVQIQ